MARTKRKPPSVKRTAKSKCPKYVQKCLADVIGAVLIKGASSRGKNNLVKAVLALVRPTSNEP